MADEELVSRLKKDVAEWNRWRKEHLPTEPNLLRADLTGAHLAQAELIGADLRYVVLNGADLRGANLIGADLSEAYLTDANLSTARIGGAVLRRATLNGARLTSASLNEANLSGADLIFADLSGALLFDTDLTEALIGWTIFNSDLSTTRGLETARHYGPSGISISTVYESGGKVPESFLRGAGVPDNFIAYIGSLVGKPFEFYSCFISYSTKDQEFADRLYADLQAANVRCWFAPEDLRIGDKFRDRIDESIRLYNKLLIILSENSVQSPWVATEVEAAFEREHREKETVVLFPIRLDDAVMKTGQAWAADIRRRRHIGDFSGWKNHDSYAKGLKRLLRDLKAEAAGR